MIGVDWRIPLDEAWERIGRRWFPTFSGVLMVEASKQLYAPSLRAERRRFHRPRLVQMPSQVRPAAGYTARRDPDPEQG